MILDQSYSVYVLIYLIIPMIFSYNLSLAKDHQQFLNKNNTENLKGIAITAIVLHHFVSAIENKGLLTPFIGIGYLGVSIFLFLSGYGLTCSLLKRADYLEEFLSKRLIKVFLPFILINVVHLIIKIMAHDIKYSLMDFLSLAFGFKLINGTMWYINAILFWYLCFYFLFKHFEISIAEKLIFIVTVIYFIFCSEVNLGKYWFDSAFAFPVGVIVCLRKAYIVSFFKRYYYWIALIAVFLFAFSFVANQGKVSIWAISVRSLASLMFILLICLFIYKVDISENKVLAFLGSVSFEIYIIHNRLLEFNAISLNNRIGIFNVVFYFILTIFIAFFINKFNSLLYLNINKIFIQQSKVLKSGDSI